MWKILTSFLFFSTFIFASIAEVTAVNGEAYILRYNQQIPIYEKIKLEKKDTIITMNNSKLQMVFNDNTIISLGQKSTFKIDDYLYSQAGVKARFNISKGLFKSITGKIGKIAPQNFQLRTQNATIGVRGTTIIGEVSKQSDSIICSAGKIIVTNSFGQVVVNKGEKTIVKKGYSPTSSIKVSLKQISVLDKTIESTTTNQITKQDNFIEETIEQSVTNIKQQAEELEKSEWNIEDIPVHDKPMPINKINKPELQLLREKVGQQNPTYSGKVYGFTMYPSKEDSKGAKISTPDIDNSIKLNFDLGVGKMNGAIKFKTDDSKLWKADIIDGTVDARGQFDFQLINNPNKLSGTGDGMLSGEKLQNADGSFVFEAKDREDDNFVKAFGTFNAIKDEEQK